MNEFRIRATGAVVTEIELRKLADTGELDGLNRTLPVVLDPTTLDALGVDAVLAAPQPGVGPYQRAKRNGVTQDPLGNWVHAWVVEDWTQAEIDAEVARQQQHIVDERKRALADARSHRAAIFSRIDGIQASFTALAAFGSEEGRAEAAAVALAIETGKVDLRNITLLNLSSATNYNEAKAIIMAEYKRIAGAAPVQVKSAYAGLDQ